MIAEALRRGVSYETIHDITKIDVWFIDKLAILVEMEAALKAAGTNLACGASERGEADRVPGQCDFRAHRNFPG